MRIYQCICCDDDGHDFIEHDSHECHKLHFDKEHYIKAVSLMYNKNNSKINPISEDDMKQKLLMHNMNDLCEHIYDAMYLYSMSMADYFGSALPDESYVMKFIKDTMDDVDAPEGHIFHKWKAVLSLKHK